MAVPVARVHLKMAHAALPALLPTPPKWKTLLQLLPSSPRVSAMVIPKPPTLAKPSRSRADSDERWDAHKVVKPTACPASYSASPPSSGPRSADRSVARRGSPRKNATSPPPPKPGRADSVERWDAHKKAASPAASSSSPSSGTTSPASSSKSPMISRATSAAERWDVHKKCCLPPRSEPLDDDGESSSTGSADIDDDDDDEEEIVWKPRAMYAGPGFVVAAPQPSLIPMPTAFLVPVA